MAIDTTIIPFDTLRKHAAMHASYNEAERMYKQGQINGRTWRIFKLFWEWSEFRFSSVKQDRAYARLGKDAFYRRLGRMKTLRLRYLASLHPEYAAAYAVALSA